MNPRLRGFATLTAVALMVLLTAFLASGVLQSSQAELDLHRVVVRQTSLGQARSSLGAGLKALGETWDPTSATFSAWASAHPIPGVTWTSWSGRFNLNTLSAFLIAKPAFAATWKDLAPEAVVRQRAETGPSADSATFRPWVREGLFDSWYTVHSLWNLNTCDEVMLEALVADRTGRKDLGSAMRALVRSFRSEKKPLGATDWDRQDPATRAALAPLVTLEPELDVNEVAPGPLTALLSDPDWALPNPTALVQALVDGRRTKPWTPEGLRTLINVPETHPLWAYLGTRSRFLGARVTSAGDTLEATIFLDQGSPPVPRVVQTEWRPR